MEWSYSCYAFWYTCLLHPAFTACAAKNRIWHLPFSFRWQQKQKGIWAFWFAYNNTRRYAWNRKYYRHFHRRFLRRTGCCVLVLAHRLLGMATTYAETFLCHHFRYQGHGGPMYILHFLLHKKTLALLYSAALTLSAFFIGCTTQSNAITETCHQVFSLPPATCAIITAFFVGLILMQGRKWIENVSIAIVPTMAIFFFGGCLLYLILHADYLLPSLKLIFSSAFAPPSIGGGFAGYTMGKAIRYGVARGLFTNESGLGTTGLIAGHCSEDDSVKQAAISMSATFWDTVVLCAITGLVLVCYQLEFPSEWQTLPASALTTAAFGKLPFFGDEILSIAIISFALATLIGWSYLGKQGFDYLFQGKYERFYQTLYLIMIFSGGIMPLALVWEMTDFINLFLLLPNIYLLVRCRKYVKKE